MTSALSRLAVCGFCILVLAFVHAARAVECSCKYQNARSEAAAGTCAPREDMARGCNLVWGASPGTQPTSPVPPAPPRSEEGAAIGDITRIEPSASSPNAEARLPGSSRMGDPAFWRDFQGEIRSRSRIEGRADLLEHSLAFLSNQGATSDFRTFTIGALIFVTSASLQSISADIRNGFLHTLLRNRDRLAAFIEGSNPERFEGDLEARNTSGNLLKGTVDGVVVKGCLDLSSDIVKVAVMIKTPWSVAKGGRC